MLFLRNSDTFLFLFFCLVLVSIQPPTTQRCREMNLVYFCLKDATVLVSPLPHLHIHIGKQIRTAAHTHTQMRGFPPAPPSRSTCPDPFNPTCPHKTPPHIRSFTTHIVHHIHTPYRNYNFPHLHFHLKGKSFGLCFFIFSVSGGQQQQVRSLFSPKIKGNRKRDMT